MNGCAARPCGRSRIPRTGPVDVLRITSGRPDFLFGTDHLRPALLDRAGIMSQPLAPACAASLVFSRKAYGGAVTTPLQPHRGTCGQLRRFRFGAASFQVRKLRLRGRRVEQPPAVAAQHLGFASAWDQSTSRSTLRRFNRSRACTTSLLSSTVSSRCTVPAASCWPGSMYSPRMRLASSTRGEAFLGRGCS